MKDNKQPVKQDTKEAGVTSTTSSLQVGKKPDMDKVKGAQADKVNKLQNRETITK